MIKFDVEKVKLLHQLMAEATGGSVGVRDEDLLDSALESAFATFGGEELYPGKEEKAAKIGFSLISNHAFVDGNKRIAAFVFLWFLSRNGLLYKTDGSKNFADGTLVALTLLIAESKPEEQTTMVKLTTNLLGL